MVGAQPAVSLLRFCDSEPRQRGGEEFTSPNLQDYKKFA